MGWRGTLRSINAAVKRAEREAQRRHKQELKAQLIDDAASAVADWEDYVDQLVSIHVDLADAINWKALRDKPKPKPRRFESFATAAAERALKEFKPRLFDFLRGGSERRKTALGIAVKEAKQSDITAEQKHRSEHEALLQEWEDDKQLAKRLLYGEADAIKTVVEEMQSFTKDGLIGSSIAFAIDDNHIHAAPEVHSTDIVPNYRRKQLASGKLSESKMPVGQFNELYQDYVASVALRVAGDLFHILPLNELVVTCKAQMLNSATGHQEMTPVLSVKFVRETIQALNLQHIDPSDSLQNFNHVMNFKKTKGFEAIDPLAPLPS